jgi:hypothetical protein
MIPKVKELKLISMYLYISDIYENELMYSCSRFSNNSEPAFADAEIMTIYLYSMHIEQRLRVKQIYDYASDHLRSWFPLLPSYVAFITRLNRLGEAFRLLTDRLLNDFLPSNQICEKSLLDSMPIITCSGKRKGKVAREITDKGFCSTKGIYYYGVKLHALAFYRPHNLPFPEQLKLSMASENDLNLFKQEWSEIDYRTFYGDKIYHDSQFFHDMANNHNSMMLTPIKGIKCEAESLKNRDKAANDLFSTAVSKIRQPIESLFNWLTEKTDIQRASKVRSTKGLMVHIFGRLAAAYIYFIFNS